MKITVSQGNYGAHRKLRHPTEIMAPYGNYGAPGPSIPQTPMDVMVLCWTWGARKGPKVRNYGKNNQKNRCNRGWTESHQRPSLYQSRPHMGQQEQYNAYICDSKRMKKLEAVLGLHK